MEQAATTQLVTGEEQRRLELFETRIERGLGIFNDVGEALAIIRDERLYRGTHGTFEDYCTDRWGMQRNYANKLIAASVVIKNLGTIVPILPLTETQARPLTGLQPDSQREVWSRVVESAPEGKVTAKHVEKTVTEWKYNQGVQYDSAASTYKAPTPKAVDDDGDVPATVTLRVARVVYLLTLGKWMGIDEVAEKTGLTENGAWRLMDRLAGGRHVPVTEMDSKWGIVDIEAQDMAI